MADDRLTKEQKEIPAAIESREVGSSDVCSAKKIDNNINIPQETVVHPNGNYNQRQTSYQRNWHSRSFVPRPRFAQSQSGFGYSNDNRQRTRRDFCNINNQTHYTQAEWNSSASPTGSAEYSTNNHGRTNVWPHRYSTQATSTNQSNSKPKCEPSSAGNLRPSEPQHYVDHFTPNFVDKPASSSNKEQIKAKQATSQEIPTVGQPERTGKLNPNAEVYVTRNNSYHRIPQPNPQYWSPGHYSSDYNYHASNGYATPFMSTPYMMRYHNAQFYQPQQVPYWHSYDYSNRTRQYRSYPGRRRELYDPNKDKKIVTDNNQSLIQTPDQAKVKTEPIIEETTHDLHSNPLPAPSETVSISTKPITILRKTNPITETENNASKELSVEKNCNEKQTSTVQETPAETTKVASNEPVNENVSNSSTPMFPDYEILALIQHSNGVAALNEYIQQKKMTINYEYLSVASTMFSCVISINGQTFSCPSKANSKSEAQKLACDFVLNILYRQSCIGDKSVIVLSDKHDWIAQKSVTNFRSLNVNELLLGRKTLAAILKVTDDDFSQAHVISIATGNASLDESYMKHIEDGSTLHDCHAEVLARRGLIRYFFEQIKQCDDNSQSIFTYKVATKKYQLHDNITFHMYISSTPCGLASMNISSNSLRYKQGQIEGTVPASTSSSEYSIKSCSDKICRWNILGLQGGLLIHFLESPIYLKSITIASESTFNSERMKFILSTRLNTITDSLPLPYRLNIPEIGCPPSKSLQIERQVSKLQSNAFAWNTTRPHQFELIEPRSGKLKNDRSASTLSKERFFFEFMELIKKKSNNEPPLSFRTYKEAKQGHDVYTNVKCLISDAFLNISGDDQVPWLSKNDQLEQFSST